MAFSDIGILYFFLTLGKKSFKIYRITITNPVDLKKYALYPINEKKFISITTLPYLTKWKKCKFKQLGSKLHSKP